MYVTQMMAKGIYISIDGDKSATDVRQYSVEPETFAILLRYLEKRAVETQPSQPSDATIGEKTQSLDNLTQREMEVFYLITKGLIVREVGELLSISTNTVSHHVKRIYTKLEVHNRAEATALAAQLGVI